MPHLLVYALLFLFFFFVNFLQLFSIFGIDWYYDVAKQRLEPDLSVYIYAGIELRESRSNSLGNELRSIVLHHQSFNSTLDRIFQHFLLRKEL